MDELDYTVPESTTSYTVNALTHGVQSGESYSFQVISVNVVGDSLTSDILSNVIAGSPPGVPQNLGRAEGVTPEDTKITLDWDTPSSDGGSAITGYTLYWNQGSLSEATEVLTTTASSITFSTVTGLTRGTTYKFRVLATNAINDGSPTSTVSIIAAQAPGQPDSITRLSFDSKTSMLIGWTAPTDDGGSPLTLDYEVHSDSGLAAGYTRLIETTSG